MNADATGAGAGRASGNSPLRWWVLGLAAIAVSSSYYESDVIGSVADLLERQRGFSQSQIGMLNGIISVPNVALALINGVLIDRYVRHCGQCWKGVTARSPQRPSSRERCAAAATASAKALATPLSPSTSIPASVVPPAERTLWRRVSGLSPGLDEELRRALEGTGHERPADLLA